mmetsp:Transcript_129220/g.414266  ORF Transcript_129220/g.414266 Transcript_129220/m.414266 type:complete len:232 (+) Transcript_129220:207-902(+)
MCTSAPREKREPQRFRDASGTRSPSARPKICSNLSRFEANTMSCPESSLPVCTSLVISSCTLRATSSCSEAVLAAERRLRIDSRRDAVASKSRSAPSRGEDAEVRAVQAEGQRPVPILGRRPGKEKPLCMSCRGATPSLHKSAKPPAPGVCHGQCCVRSALAVALSSARMRCCQPSATRAGSASNFACALGAATAVSMRLRVDTRRGRACVRARVRQRPRRAGARLRGLGL